jgi:O-methyltransferase involved in polyketide biosynthesis
MKHVSNTEDLAPILDYQPWRAQTCSRAVPLSFLERLTADLNEEDERTRVLDEASSKGARLLLLTEGPLYYLPASTVCGLGVETATQSGNAGWILDVNPQALMRLQATGAEYRKVRARNAAGGRTDLTGGE